MNTTMMRAFRDELTKIADWSLAGPALAQHSAESLAAGGPHGTFTSADQLQQIMRQKDMEIGVQQRAGALREQKMNEMLQSGQWNPKTHKVDQAGNLVPLKVEKTTIRGAAPGSVPPTPHPAQVAERLGPTGTVIGQPAAAAERPAAAGAAKVLNKVRGAARGAAGKVRGGGRLGIGLGALGLGLGAGLGMGSPAPAPAMG